MQGSKLVIEGPFAKSGKTALAVTLGIMKMDQNPDLIGFGNLGIKHDQFEKRKSITPSYFDRDREYLCIRMLLFPAQQCVSECPALAAG